MSDNEWLDNIKGVMPVDGGVIVDVELKNGEIIEGDIADSWDWVIRDDTYFDIIKWRIA